MANFTSAHTGDEIDAAVASGSTTTGIIKDFTTLSGSSVSTITTNNIITQNITASGNISASGTIIANTFQSTGGDVAGIEFSDDLNITGDITASGNISASGTAHTFGGTIETNTINASTIGAATSDVTFRGNNITITSDAAGDIKFKESLTEVMRYDGGLDAFGIGTTTPSSKLTVAGNISASGNINTFTGTGSFGQIHQLDNQKILIGTGNDLQISHNGSDSFIIDTGTGDLIVRAATNFKVQATSTNEDMIKAIKDGGVELYHNNVKKLETEAGGIDVTGHITASGNISASGNITADTVTVASRTNGRVAIYGTNGLLQEDGDLSFSGNTLSATQVSSTNITASGNISSSGNVIAATVSTPQIFNAGLKVGRDADNLIDFTTDDQIQFRVGASNELKMNTSTLFPAGNDGMSLGAAGNEFSDLFLADGAVISFNSSELAIQQSHKQLLFGGMDGTNFVGHITASGNISSSGTITGNSIVGTLTGTATGLAGTPDITVGSLTATSITSSIVTSSIVLSEGSNTFGDAISDTQTFNGHITASGNISASGVISATGGFDLSTTMTNGGNNRVVTATGTGAQNAEANLLFDGSKLEIGGKLKVSSHITASGNISSSGDLTANSINTPFASIDSAGVTSARSIFTFGTDSAHGQLQNSSTNGNITIKPGTTSGKVFILSPNQDALSITSGSFSVLGEGGGGHITASGNISSSGTFTANDVSFTNLPVSQSGLTVGQLYTLSGSQLPFSGSVAAVGVFSTQKFVLIAK